VQQLHKRFTTEQVKALLRQYDQGHMPRNEVQELLGIGKTRFFALLADYRQDVAAFSVTEEVAVHLVPDTLKNVMEVRIWWQEKMVHSVAFLLGEFTVHL